MYRSLGSGPTDRGDIGGVACRCSQGVGSHGGFANAREPSQERAMMEALSKIPDKYLAILLLIILIVVWAIFREQWIQVLIETDAGVIFMAFKADMTRFPSVGTNAPAPESITQE